MFVLPVHHNVLVILGRRLVGVVAFLLVGELLRR